MLGCNCLSWSRVTDLIQPDLDLFSLPEPLPQWPQGSGFATSRIKLGYLLAAGIMLIQAGSMKSWRQYMRKWGPTIVCDSKTDLEKMIKRLPPMFTNSMSNIVIWG